MTPHNGAIRNLETGAAERGTRLLGDHSRETEDVLRPKGGRKQPSSKGLGMS